MKVSVAAGVPYSFATADLVTRRLGRSSPQIFGLTTRALIGYAADLGLDTARFTADLRKHAGAGRVAEDIDSADLATVSGTPTFFINGNRYYGAFDLAALTEAVHTAKGRAVIRAR